MIDISKIYDDIVSAATKIKPHILKTPLVESKELSEAISGKVFFKLESEQYTGSFKARGSLHKLLSLSEEQKAQGVITASTGNHGLGFARALEITNTKGTVYLPEKASKAKIKALSYYPVELIFHKGDSLETELFAKEEAQRKNKIWVSPYNDPQVIAGQGTIALEVSEQIDHFDAIFVTVGGGGMISGIGSFINTKLPQTRVVGCQPENSPEMKLSVEAGKICALPEFIETLSDGSAGGIEEGAITFPICQKVIDEFILVSEQEIIEGLGFAFHTHHKIIEGSAAVTIASLIQQKEKFKGQTVVLVLCGSNIDTHMLKELV